MPRLPAKRLLVADDSNPTTARLVEGRALIVGAGLMGGSVGMVLRERGWHVSGVDTDAARAARGVELGAFDVAGDDLSAELVVVCVPVSLVADVASQYLSRGAIVTDIGSTKAGIVERVNHPRFVGGHPMAGSERDGIDASDTLMFQGRTWVLTPTEVTDPNAYARLHTLVSSFGATVVSVSPQRHDELVAIVSHVPHLTAAALMGVAASAAEEHATLLRLAAGGFRDMTRIAAGHPLIWLDICAENRTAIVDVLGQLIDALGEMRETVERNDRSGLSRVLTMARAARVNLPTGAPPAEELLEIWVPIPDRPGFIAEISTLASELNVNIYDIEVTHALEARRGTLVLVVDVSAGDLLRGGLMARGFKPSISRLGER
jgi:prephenate dehydrogenase